VRKSSNIIRGGWIGRAVLLCVLSSTVPSASAIAQTPARESGAYSVQAASAYEDAERSFRNGDYLEAIRRYNLLRTKYPYSEFATLADLRIADAYFEQDKFATSIEQYRAFVKLHPEHGKVTYANWRVALSFYEQMPKDFALFPPGYERDLVRARDAERELLYYLRRFPKTEYSAEAKTKLALTRRRLADHELYVAEFYFKRDNPRAAAMRLTYLLKNYQGLGLDPQALFLLARAYLELGDTDKAVVALSDLIEVHPERPLAGRARAYMARYKLSPKRAEPAPAQ